MSLSPRFPRPVPFRRRFWQRAALLLALAAPAFLAGCSSKSSAEKEHEKGVLWVKNGKYYNAIERFQEVLEKEPDRPDTLALLAECYLNTAKPEQAVETALKALEKQPDNVEAQLTLGQAYLAVANKQATMDLNGQPVLEPGNLAKAQEITKKLTDAHPDSAAGLILQAKIDTLSGRVDTAEREFRRAREMDPANLTATLGLIDALLSQRKPEKLEQAEAIAAEEYNKLEAESNASLIVAYARTLGAKGDFEQALEILQPAIAEDNKTPDFMQQVLAAQLMMARVGALDGTTDTARLVLNGTDSPTTPTASANTSAALRAERDAVVERFGNLAALMKGRYPKRPEPFYFRGLSYQMMGKLPEASAEFDRAVSEAPGMKEFRMAQAATLLQRRMYSEARQAYGNVLKLYPTDFDARLRIAQCLMLEGVYEEAASMLEKLSFEQPANLAITQMRGRALMLTGDPKKVEIGLSILTRVNDPTGKVPGSEDFARGLADLRDAQKLTDEGKLPDANAKLGDAEKQFSAALKAKPDNFIAAFQLSELAERRGDRFEALRYLQLATRYEPALLDRQAGLFARLGQVDNALDVYREIQKVSPSIQNELRIVDLLTQIGRDAEADRLTDDLLLRHPNSSEVILRKGVLIGRQRTIEDGVNYLQPFLEKYPDDIALRVAYGRLLFLANRAPEAIELLEGTIQRARSMALSSTGEGAAMERVDRALLPLYQELIVANLLAGQGAAALANVQKAMAMSWANPAEFRLLETIAEFQTGAFDQAVTTLAGIPNRGEPAAGQILLQTLAKAATGDVAGAVAELEAAPRVGDESAALYRLLLEQTPQEKLREVAPTLALQVYLAARPLYAPAALHLAELSLAKLPDSAFLLTRKADTEALVGKRREAYETLLKVQQLRPDSAAVLLAQSDLQGRLALEARARGDEQAAQAATAATEQAIRDALKLAPDDPTVQEKLSLFLQTNGRVDEANQFYRDLIKSNPKSSVPYNNLAWNLAEAGQLDEAIKLGEKALELSPNDGGVLDTVGYIEFKRGKHERALELLNKAVRLLPGVPTVRLHQAMAMEQLGKQGEAVLVLETLIAAAPGSPDAEQARAILKRLAPDSRLLAPAGS